MEGYEAMPKEESMDESVREFIERLIEIDEECPPAEDIDGTYEIEADAFTLNFTIDAEFFEIRNIDVRGNTGLGRKIINAIHEHADEHGLEVIASNVLDTARGFWKKMGYEESADGDDTFYRTE